MTDYCKVRLIGKMVSDVIEFTDWSKDNIDALVACIQTVVEYDGGDYPTLQKDLDFSFDHLPGISEEVVAVDIKSHNIEIMERQGTDEDHSES